MNLPASIEGVGDGEGGIGRSGMKRQRMEKGERKWRDGEE